MVSCRSGPPLRPRRPADSPLQRRVAAAGEKTPMTFRSIAGALALLLAAGAIASAQQQTGEVFGKVTDASGAVLPGVTVSLTGPVLLQPLTAVSSDTGTYQFPRLEV